ncbi:hypothetical protein [Pseudoalteromonas spongiae]|uniref:hypothetical protein n=1 Tax=Pseudoalteromonas spongiae TaxID=298657 RepID=UPI0012FD807E|nr:hypothetical protein [Pseudoalteromonas spongiae]
MMNEVGMLIGILVGIASIVGVINRIQSSFLTQGHKRVEYYQKLQALCGSDANNNLAEILVILRVFTRAHLTNKEIEWFIWTPGAFRCLPEYGKKIELIDIDYKNNTFIWRGKFKYWYRRLGLAMSLCLIYLITGIASASFILYTVQHFNIEKITEFTFYSVVSLFLLFIAIYVLIRLYSVLPPQLLIGRKLRGVNT